MQCIATLFHIDLGVIIDEFPFIIALIHHHTNQVLEINRIHRPPRHRLQSILPLELMKFKGYFIRNIFQFILIVRVHLGLSEGDTFWTLQALNASIDIDTLRGVVLHLLPLSKVQEMQKGQHCILGVGPEDVNVVVAALNMDAVEMEIESVAHRVL